MRPAGPLYVMQTKEFRILPPRPLRIGTRGSPLALWQARHVRDHLIEEHGLSDGNVELSIITTSGDRIADKPLRDFGGKGLFTKEIDEALLSGAVELAVHSMKDLPTVLPEGIIVAAVLPRATPSSAPKRRRLPSCRRAPSSAPRPCGARPR
jgi:hydroxymethylbilane synthase